MLAAHSRAASHRRFWIGVAIAAAAAFALGNTVGRIRTSKPWLNRILNNSR